MSDKPKLRTNFAYNLAYQILAIILPLITAPYIARVLGAHNLGVYSYTQAMASYFFLFAMLGVNNYGNRTIAAVRNNTEKLRKTFWEIYSFQFSVGIFVFITYLFYCVCFVKEDFLISCLQCLYVASGWFGINWLMFGLEKFKLIAIRNIVVRVSMLIAIFLFVKSEADLSIYTMIIAGGNLVSVLTIWPFTLKLIGFKKPSIQGIVKHIKPNLVLFWPVIAVSIYTIMDKMMLGVFSSKREVAFYTYAESIVQIPNTLILALDSVMLPRMSNLYATDNNEKAMRLMNDVMILAMMASAAMSFGIAGVGKEFGVWFYGEDFVRCGDFIVLLAPIIIFKGWAGALRTQYIIPKKRDKVYLISLTLGAVINLILNIVFIPRYHGVGAIIGTIVAEFSVAFIQFFMLRHEIKLKRYIKNGLSFCLIGFIMFLIITVIESIQISIIATIIVQVIVGAIVYMALTTLYLVKFIKEPTIVNELLKVLRIKYRF